MELLAISAITRPSLSFSRGCIGSNTGATTQRASPFFAAPAARNLSHSKPRGELPTWKRSCRNGLPPLLQLVIPAGQPTERPRISTPTPTATPAASWLLFITASSKMLASYEPRLYLQAQRQLAIPTANCLPICSPENWSRTPPTRQPTWLPRYAGSWPEYREPTDSPYCTPTTRKN